ncbi:hypothetical protein V2J09_022218 [Rumex salicifolius]
MVRSKTAKYQGKRKKNGAIKNRSAKKKAKTRQSIEGPSFATISNTDNEATDDETLEEILQGKRQEIRNETTRKKEEKKKEQEKERRKNKIEVSKKKKQGEKKEKKKKTGKKGGKKEENDQEKFFILKSKLPKEGTNTGMRALRQQYKTLVCRTSPNMIVKYFASGENEFIAAQRQAIIDLGFEALLEWKIRDFPMRLGYYVCKRFDPLKCIIKLNDGKEILMTEEDPHDYLGLPIGGSEVILPNSLKSEEFVGKLRLDFRGKDTRNITHTDIYSKMKGYDGDAWFKRYFILMFVNTVIERHPNGKINFRILELLNDIDNVKNFNWSSFIYHMLIHNCIAWAGTTEGTFKGSLQLLLVKIFMKL